MTTKVKNSPKSICIQYSITVRRVKQVFQFFYHHPLTSRSKKIKAPKKNKTISSSVGIAFIKQSVFKLAII